MVIAILAELTVDMVLRHGTIAAKPMDLTIEAVQASVVSTPISTGFLEGKVVADFPGNRGAIFSNFHADGFEGFTLIKHCRDSDSVIKCQMFILGHNNLLVLCSRRQHRRSLSYFF